MLKRAKEVGYANWDWAARDPDLVCLRDDPEFLRLIEEGERKGYSWASTRPAAPCRPTALSREIAPMQEPPALQVTMLREFRLPAAE